ncbi:MetQ/NlpA family ABC transporter substrate-binding protein [Microbacterium excoecariae]|uniref:MetQ/NlpA family ABC transporter substrate-binding protein n=1 Tax=Microbacterium excoecariae TaxID=2715210 RepID=UPI00140DA94B|nr:MetQ/NlpA family ABC transporter substrate-binding protein [Microbacterium excoecariae]NHI17625.1 methionine ABC transporter substrate-binding protein [Microbacterium excoecariae]
MSHRARSLAALSVAGVLALSGCATGASDAELGSEENPVQMGVVGASDPYWETYTAAAEDEGIFVDLVDFTEYTQPNPALSAGELDINQFQHVIYLADYNVAAGDDLQPIGATVTYPLGLYSAEFDDIAEIPEGGTVLVPNDTTNQARGLLVLQSAGLLELEDGGSPFSTLDDVIAESSRVEVKALDAALLAPSLPDADAAIINNDFLEAAGLTSDDAIFQDDPADPSAQPYVNIFATRADDVDDEVLNRLVEIYQTNQDVLDGVIEVSGGTAVPATTPKDELQASLAEVEDAARDAG